MKYITTDKHPELKEGIEIKFSEHDGNYWSKLGFAKFSKHQFKDMLSMGYFKELQEPKWTDDDMIDFAFWVLGEQDNYEKETIKLDDWLKQINK